MALGSYADLKAAIPRWLRRSDIADVVPDLIALAEASMSRELRTALQLVVQPFTINAERVNLPAGFMSMRYLRITSGAGGLIKEWTLEEMARAKAFPAAVTGIPRRFCRIGGQLEFWPLPQVAFECMMGFQATIPALSDDAPSNWVLANHPDAYLYGTLCAGSAFAKSFGNAEAWKAEYDRVIGEIQDALRPSYDRTLRCDPAVVSAGRPYAGVLFQSSADGTMPGGDGGGGFDFSNPGDSDFIGT